MLETMTVPNREILTAPELADWLQVSKKCIETRTQARQVPGQFKVGRVWRYDRTAIQVHMLKTGNTFLTGRAR